MALLGSKINGLDMILDKLIKFSQKLRVLVLKFSDWGAEFGANGAIFGPQKSAPAQTYARKMPFYGIFLA